MRMSFSVVLRRYLGTLGRNDTSATPMSDLFRAGIPQGLEARDDAERSLKAQVISVTMEIAQLRSLMPAESSTSIFKPMLDFVVLWLVLIFLGFSLFASPNAIATVALIASAMCAGRAIIPRSYRLPRI
jgi:hypothetical protein